MMLPGRLASKEKTKFCYVNIYIFYNCIFYNNYIKFYDLFEIRMIL